MLGYTIVGLQTPFLKQLVSVDFTRLEKLEIIRCKIESLEPLSWLDASNFKTVYLRDNFVMNLKPLVKTKWNNFKSL